MNPGRNSPCPCGSGRKFKHCCGAVGGAPPGAGGPGFTQHRPAASAYVNQGNALAAQGRLEQAIAHYERALALRPDYPEAHNNLGNALALQGKMEQAIIHFGRALALRPNADIYNNLGNAVMAQGNLEQAIAHYERALALRPNADICNNLGNAVMAQGRLDEAVTHYEQALALKPDHPEAHGNLGAALVAQGRLEEAIGHYERALALKPDYPEAHSGLLLALNYMPDSDPSAVHAAYRDYGRRRETSSSAPYRTHPNDRSQERRLRIGYVSSDFRQHSVACFIEPVLENHDRERFEIFCYSNSLLGDEITERLKPHADHWRGIYGWSDELTVKQIGDDQIDILIDLNGHTASNRLPVFAGKPAPIQVTWLGSPNTTGLSAMDYRITDGFADPVGMTAHLHSERLARLPECFSCYKPPVDAPEISTLPAREKGYITFGSFNNLAKVTPEVITVWARVLHAVPGSRLTLKNSALGGATAQQRMREAFAGSDITPERLELLGHDRSPKAHLERYRSIDIGLDSFPYNGATTTCEALWMGVPVVTLAGKTHAGRVGASLMSNLGLAEFICHTSEEYVATATQLASDLGRLAVLRKELRPRMAASPLTDARHFTKNLEQAYRTMWRDWCLEGSRAQKTRTAGSSMIEDRE